MSSAEEPDRIVLLHDIAKKYSVPPVPETLVLIDANSPTDGGCIRDAARTDDLAFTNLIDAGGCGRDEIVVFSVNDPLVMDAGVSGRIWTAADGETRSVDLSGGALRVPIMVWITQQTTTDGHSVSQIAGGDISTANLYFNRQRTGVRVFRARTRKVWRPDQAAAVGMGCPKTMPTAYFRPDTINVYYVAELGSSADRGVQCRDADWNAIYISIADRSPNTLAHELGHAFGLEHTGQGSTAWYVDTEGSPLLQPDNLMWGDSRAGSTFTLGQAFRINVDPNSMMNRNGVRSGPVRECECRLWNGGCDSTDGAENRRKYLIESDRNGTCPRITRGWQ